MRAALAINGREKRWERNERSVESHLGRDQEQAL
jgi:hypothetical protein